MVDSSTNVTKIPTSLTLTQAQIVTAVLIGCVILTLVVLNIFFFIVYCNVAKSYKRNAEKNRKAAAMFVNQLRPVVGDEEEVEDCSKMSTNCESNSTKIESVIDPLPFKGSSDGESTPKPPTDSLEGREKSLHVKKHVQIKSTKGRNESWSKKNNRGGEKKGLFKPTGNLFKSVRKNTQESPAFELSSDFTCVNMKNLRSVRSDSLTVNDIETIQQFASDKHEEEKEKMEMHMHRSVSESEGLGNFNAKNIVDERQINTIGKSYMFGSHDHHRVMPFAISAGGSTSHLSSVTVTHGATVVQISDFGQTSVDDENLETTENDDALSANYLKAPTKNNSIHHSVDRRSPSPRGSNSHQKQQLVPKKEESKRGSVSYAKSHGDILTEEMKDERKRGSIFYPKGHREIVAEEKKKGEESRSESSRASFSHDYPVLQGEDNSHQSTKEQHWPMKDKNTHRKGSVLKIGEKPKKTKHSSKAVKNSGLVQKEETSLKKEEKRSKKTKQSSKTAREKTPIVIPRKDGESVHKDEQTVRKLSLDFLQISDRRMSIPQEKDLPKGVIVAKQQASIPCHKEDSLRDDKSKVTVIGPKQHSHEERLSKKVEPKCQGIQEHSSKMDKFKGFRTHKEHQESQKNKSTRLRDQEHLSEKDGCKGLSSDFHDGSEALGIQEHVSRKDESIDLLQRINKNSSKKDDSKKDVSTDLIQGNHKNAFKKDNSKYDVSTHLLHEKHSSKIVQSEGLFPGQILSSNKDVSTSLSTGIQENPSKKDKSKGLEYREQFSPNHGYKDLPPGMCSVMCVNPIIADVKDDSPKNTKRTCERNVSTDTINSLEVAILARESENYGEIEIVDHSSLSRLKRPLGHADVIPVLEFQNLGFDSRGDKNDEYIGDIEL